jgi:putative acetyltransferase
VLVGNPAYYSRFGFRPFPELVPEGEPEEYFQILALAKQQPDVVVAFHPLFHGDTA